MGGEFLRHPAVAGRFYPGDPAGLRVEAEAYLSQAQAKNHKAVRAIGCIAPHAGYMYSGHVAGAVFAHLDIPERCVILCPNHTGVGLPLAIMSQGAWETPLGNVPIDTSIALELKEHFPALREDSAAHRAEHAIEVELPFLQIRQPGLRFVPIALGTRDFSAL
jgi:MEMO1 family protein